MKKPIFFKFLILTFIYGLSFGQDPILKKSGVSRSPNGTGTTTDFATVSGQAMDKDGNRFLAGRFKGTYDFDPKSGVTNITSTLTGSASGYDLFITKLDKNDNLIWIKTIGSALDTEFVKNLTVDPSGNVIITGMFRADMDFDPGAGVFSLSNGITAPDFQSLFMLKLNANGEFAWAKNFQANTTSGLAVSVDDMSTDAQNNIYCSGYFFGQIDLDPGAGTATVLSPSNANYGFFFKIDASGNYVFHRQYGNSYFFNGSTSSIQQPFGRSSVVDAVGNIYALWSFRDFTGLTYTFLDKYSSTGTLLGFYSVALSNSAGITYLRTVLDNLGNVFISANRSVVKISTASMNSTSTSAAAIWTKPIVGFHIGIDNNNNIIKTGNFSSPEDFDPGAAYFTVAKVNSFADALISKLDNDGNFIYAKGLGAAGNSNANASVIKQNITSYGDVQIWGYFDNSIDVDPSAGSTILTNTTGSANPGFWATYSHIPCTTTPTSSSTTVSTCTSYYWPTAAETYTTSGVYTHTLTNFRGCDSTITLNLTINPLPTIALSNNNGTFLTCTNPNTTVTATGADTYVWTGPSGFTASTAAVTLTIAGTYFVTGTTTAGCSATNSIVITENKTAPNVTTNVTGSAQPLTCAPGTAVSITAYGANSFVWTGPNGFSSTSNTFSTSNGGSYVVVGTNTSNGCTGTTTRVITENKTPPTLSIASPTTLLTCTTPSITLTASGGSSYSWTKVGVGLIGSGTTTVAVTQPATYRLEGKNPSNLCSATTDIVITENKVAPVLSISPASVPALTCSVPTATLTASGADTYSWAKSGGGFSANSAAAVVSSAGTYTVTGTSTVNGCTGTATSTITENKTVPSFSLSPANPVNLTCSNPNLSISSAPGSLTGATYAWTGPNGFNATSYAISPTVVGAYTVTVTATNGCTSSVIGNINSINTTIPTITVSPSSAVLTCSNPTVSLTASGGSGNNYSWTRQSDNFVYTGASVAFNQPGTYAVVGTTSAGCTGTTTVIITEDKTPPTVAISPATAVLDCTNPTLNLTASGAVTYAWSRSGGGFSATTPTVTVSSANTYFVTGTAANGCTASANRNVTSNTVVPSSSLSYNSTVLTCTVPTMEITAIGLGTYQWSGPSSFSANTATITASIGGTYTVVITGANGCTRTASVAITENKTPPAFSITKSVPNFTCTTSTINLAHSGNSISYNWTKLNDPFSASGVTSINVTTTGTYILTGSASNGCTATASAVLADDKDPPVVAISPTTAVLTCTNPTAVLTASGGNTYLWSRQFHGNVGTTPSITTTGGGIYTVVATGTNGCTASTTANITVNNSIPSFTVTPATTELNCANPSITLTASTADNYVWTKPGNSTQTGASITITVPGTYSVTGTNANGCFTTVTREITQNNVLSSFGLSSTAATVTCLAPTATITASGANFYSWSGPNSFTANTAAVNLSVAGTYNVSASSGACNASGSVVISENKVFPTVTISPSTVALTCTSPTAVLTANGSSGVSYAWTLAGDPFTANTAAITATKAGVYTVVVTNATGCTTSANVTVTGENILPPVITIAATPANATTTCSLPYVILNPTVVNTYSWTGPNGFTSSNGWLNVSTPGLYTLIGTGANGCKDTTSITLIEDKAIPTINISPTTTELTCTNPTLNLTASGTGNATYSWRGDPFVGAIVSPNLTVTAPGTFSIFATASNGCTKFQLFTITESKVLPTVTISSNISNNELSCTNPSRTLTASGGATYAWSGPNGFTATTAAITVSIAGTYTVVATGSNGCTATASRILTGDALPPVISVSQTSVMLTCTNSTATISASGYTNFTWSGPNGFASALSEVTISNAGTYVVTATKPNGCSSNLNVVVSENKALPTLNVVGLTTYCSGENIALTATSNISSFLWTGPNTFSSSQAAISVSNATSVHAGLYTASVTGTNGCTATVITNIIVNPKPTLTIINPPASVSVNITLPTVTNGSTLPQGTVLSYFADIAASSVIANPAAITASGTYYIKASIPNSTCVDIKPVLVLISSANCPENLALNGTNFDISTGTILKEASATTGSINATNKLTGTANVSYKARAVILEPGFKADTGVLFKAETGGCN